MYIPPPAPVTSATRSSKRRAIAVRTEECKRLVLSRSRCTCINIAEPKGHNVLRMRMKNNGELLWREEYKG